MKLSEINPKIRYARYLNLDAKTGFSEMIPLDARLFYTVSGEGIVKVKNKEYKMQPHSLLLINAGIPYELCAPAEAVSYAAINFDYTQRSAARSSPISPVLPEQYRAELRVDPCFFEDAAELNEVLYVARLESVRRRLGAIIGEYIQKRLYYELKIGHQLAACIADGLRAPDGRDSAENEPAGQILAYLHSHYDRPLTNRSVGREFGYHPNYVGALIKRATGMPAHRYLIRIRLMHAAFLLENSDRSLGEIAAACGFCDLAYFSNCFKKQFGVRPSAYKNT